MACVDLEGELVRLWVTFDLSALSLDEADSSIIKVDGGPYWHRLLWRGVGVTGFDENDCLNLIAQAIAPHSLPPISSIESGVSVEKIGIDLARLAVPVWRGIWSPPMNVTGPTPFHSLPTFEINANDQKLWALLRSGKTAGISKGFSATEIVRCFGKPSQQHLIKGRPAILKYDAIELLFNEDGLGGVHCEFGSPPLPASVTSERLELTPGPFCWPMDLSDVLRSSWNQGLLPVRSERYGMEAWTIGFGELLNNSKDELISFGVTLTD
jgi:hypothetical protein